MTAQNREPTIYDVAKLAGVSANTVSKVLNGKPGVGERTRVRIKELIREVGYHPHAGARSLRTASAGSIGVTLPAPVDKAPLSQGFFLWLFAELYRVFGQSGERICFDMNPFAGDENADYTRGLWEHYCTTCIIAGPISCDDTRLRHVHESGAPYLSLGRLDSLPECSAACVDYEHAAYISTRYLVGRGHKQVAILKALHGFQPGLERRRGYVRALEEAGYAPDENLIRNVRFGASNLASMVHRLLVDRDVTAFIDASGTEDGASICEGARRAGRVPGSDFELVCWTYENNAAVVDGACAHVWLPVREAASEGLDQLAEWHYGRRDGPIHVVFPPVLEEEVTGGEVPKPKRLFETGG